MPNSPRKRKYTRRLLGNLGFSTGCLGDIRQNRSSFPCSRLFIFVSVRPFREACSPFGDENGKKKQFLSSLPSRLVYSTRDIESILSFPSSSAVFFLSLSYFLELFLLPPYYLCLGIFSAIFILRARHPCSRSPQ